MTDVRANVSREGPRGAHIGQWTPTIVGVATTGTSLWTILAAIE